MSFAKLLNKFVLAGCIVLARPISAPAQVPDTPVVFSHDTQAPSAPCPSMESCTVWRAFRTAHPWPYQSFAVSERTGEAVIIISEPPVLSRADFAALLPAIWGHNLVDMGYYRWPTGVDGWLEDVVLRVRVTGGGRASVVTGAAFRRWQIPAGIADRLHFLHKLMYGTSDGFWVDRVGGPPPAKPQIRELRAPVSDVAGWLAEATKLWTPLAGPGAEKTTKELYAAQTPGVFQREGGVVALVVPRGARLADLAGVFRQFAVGSDLIIGAAGSSTGTMLILARLRQIPLAALPPLRFESFVTYARNRATHLAQSYERQRIFAGRIRSGRYVGWDWAPILLSPQLDDTEFGTLLNLADQILKSWSQHGQVEYFAFQYPKPRTYPFRGMAASDYFVEKFQTASLLFNWNTEGLATISGTNDAEILTGDRTGALSVLYRPSHFVADGDATAASARSMDARAQVDADARARDAREYFATMGDPILVRVVQNVMLYQAIQSFLSVSDAQENAERPARSDTVAGVLQQEATVWLKEVLRPGSREDPEVRSAVTRFLRDSGSTAEQLARLLASPQAVQRDLMRVYQRYRTSMAEARMARVERMRVSEQTDKLFPVACEAAGGRIVQKDAGGLTCNYSPSPASRAALSPYLEKVEREKELVAQYEAATTKAKEHIATVNALRDTYGRAEELGTVLSRRAEARDLDGVLRKVLDITGERAPTGFIRTPSVVLSKNSIDVYAVGGHNIDLTPQLDVNSPPRRRVGAAGTTPPGAKPRRPPVPVAVRPAPPHLGSTRPPVEVLGSPGPDNLLEATIVAFGEAERNPEIMARAREKARTCRCDVLAEYVPEGQAIVIRNSKTRNSKTPVEHWTVKGQVHDLIKEPPPAEIVRLDNFPVETSTAIWSALDADLKRAGGDGRLSRAFVDAVRRWFNPASEPPRDVTMFLIGKSQTRIFVAGSDGTALEKPVVWRNARVEAATTAAWNHGFSPGVADSAIPPDRVILHVGPGTLRVAASKGLGAKLRATLSKWTLRQPLRPTTARETLPKLADDLQDVDPERLMLFWTEQGEIRTGQLGSPAVCHAGQCGT